jgi:hypothetical protein
MATMASQKSDLKDYFAHGFAKNGHDVFKFGIHTLDYMSIIKIPQYIKYAKWLPSKFQNKAHKN